MTLRKNILLSLVSCLFAFALVACTQNNQDHSSNDHNDFASEPQATEQTIKGNHYIAVAAPLTGAYSELGKTILEGATLAVEEFNESVAKSNQIGILTIDDGGLVGEALERADIVIAQNSLGVIGHLNSQVSIEASKKYAEAKIPQISPASTHPYFTERPNMKGYVFRTIGTDRQLGAVAADFVIKNKYSKVAVLYNDRPYGVSVAGEFVRRLAKSSSKELVFYETIPVRRTDHSETVKKVASKKPDLVYFVGEYNDAGYLLKQLKQKLPKVQFLAAEGVHNQEFINIASNDAEGAIVVGMETLPSKVKQKYLNRYKRDDSAFVKTSYEATHILLEAIKANKFKNPGAVAKTIAGNQIFDPNGDLIKPNFVLYQVSGSKFVAM